MLNIIPFGHHKEAIQVFQNTCDLKVTITGFSDPAKGLPLLSAIDFQTIARRNIRAAFDAVFSLLPSLRLGVIHGATPRGIDLVVQQETEAYQSKGYHIQLLGVTTSHYQQYLPPSLPFPIIVMPDNNEGEDCFEFGMSSFGDMVWQIGGRTRALGTSIMAVTQQQKYAVVANAITLKYGNIGNLPLGIHDVDPTSALLSRLIRINATETQTIEGLADKSVAEISQRLIATIGGAETLLPSPQQQRPSVPLKEAWKRFSISQSRPASFNSDTSQIWKEKNKYFLLKWFSEKEQALQPDIECIGRCPDTHRWGYVRTFENLKLLEASSGLLAYLKKDSRNVFLGPTGFSSLKPKDLELLNLKSTNVYIKGVSKYLALTVSQLALKFPGLRFVMTDGCSNSGVDQGAIEAQQMLASIPSLGVLRLGLSCIDYLWYAADVAGIAVVADTINEYGENFPEINDILFALGGRDHALKLDLQGVLERENKVLVLVELIEVLSGVRVRPAPYGPQGRLTNASNLFGTMLRVVLDGEPSSFASQVVSILPQIISESLQSQIDQALLEKRVREPAVVLEKSSNS